MRLKCSPLIPMGRRASILPGSAGSKEQSDSVTMNVTDRGFRPITSMFLGFFKGSRLSPKWTCEIKPMDLTFHLACQPLAPYHVF